MRPRAAALQDALDQRSVLGLELADPAVTGVLGVGSLVHLDAQAPVGVVARGARDAAVQAVERDRAGAAGQADAVGDLGNGPDLGIVTFVDRYERTRSSSPTSTGSVTFMFGKTTTSSRGTRSRVSKI